MQKTIAFLVIGDEILSGRTQDVNVQTLADRLGEIGHRLAEVRMVPDEADEIVDALHALSAKHDFLFTSGGIGPTHDDITADCVAKAFGLGIGIREDARAILATNYENGEADLTDARLRMARIPDGATLIKNSISKAPGFRVANVFVCAGVPKIFNAMLDDALPQIGEGQKTIAKSFIVNLPESKIATPLKDIAEAYPELSIGSYPQDENGRFWAEIVVKGFDEARIDEAIECVKRIE